LKRYNITIKELVAMFLIILYYARETISRHFTCVLMVVSRIAVDIIDHIDREFKNVPSKILNNE